MSTMFCEKVNVSPRDELLKVQRVDVEFRCARCHRAVNRRFVIDTMLVKTYGVREAFQKTMSREWPRCDCDRRRCRVGAAYQRKYRLTFGINATDSQKADKHG
jgi:hypothetical protein